MGVMVIGVEIAMKPSSPQQLLKQVLAEDLDWYGARLNFLAY